MKKLNKTLFIFISLVLLSGCWDRTEVNDLAFVTATGFDKEGENKFSIAVQIPLPSAMGGAGSSGGGGGTSGGPSYVDSETGRNVREANDKLQRRMSRKLFFGHRRVLVFGSDLAKGGFKKSLDVILEQPQSRLSTYVLITEGKAVDILTAETHLEKLSAEFIREVVKAGIGVTVKDVMNDMGQPGKDPVVPIVKVVKTKNGKAKDKKGELLVSRVAILKDDQLKFIANEKESIGVLWLLEEMEGKPYTFSVGEQDEMNVLIKKLNVQTTYTIKNNLPNFHIAISTDSNVMQNEPGIQLGNEKEYKKTISFMEKQIKEEVTTILKHSMAEGVDVYGLGLHLLLHDNQKWEEEWEKKWDELLKEIDVKVTVTGNIEQVINSGVDVRG